MGHYRGEVYSTNTSGNLEVTKYINSKEVEVRFLATGFEKTVRMEHVIKGKVKDPLHRSVFGVGFIGVGEFKVSVNRKSTKAYQCWVGMLERCYSKKLHKKYPTYIGCTVHPDWHNFQTFAKWYQDNYPVGGDKYQLDKDLLVEGNKVYSKDTCMFVTGAENMIKAHAKSYTLINPEGEEVEIYNMTKFCRHNNLSRVAMCHVNSGKQSSHKSWTK